MMKLIKDGKGNYYTADHQYWIERYMTGWDVHELKNDGMYQYAFTVDTLKEFRLIMKNRGDCV